MINKSNTELIRLETINITREAGLQEASIYTIASVREYLRSIGLNVFPICGYTTFSALFSSKDTYFGDASFLRFCEDFGKRKDENDIGQGRFIIMGVVESNARLVEALVRKYPELERKEVCKYPENN